MSDIRTNSPCCSVLVWASFCFVRLINKNVCSQTYPDAALIYIYILYTDLSSCFVPLSRVLNHSRDHTSSYSSPPPPQKKVVLPPVFLKILQYSQKKSVKIFKNTFFKEHLRMAASELNLRSHLQPSRLSNITEIPVAFKPKL